MNVRNGIAEPRLGIDAGSGIRVSGLASGREVGTAGAVWSSRREVGASSSRSAGRLRSGGAGALATPSTTMIYDHLRRYSMISDEFRPKNKKIIFNAAKAERPPRGENPIVPNRAKSCLCTSKILKTEI